MTRPRGCALCNQSALRAHPGGIRAHTGAVDNRGQELEPSDLSAPGCSIGDMHKTVAVTGAASGLGRMIAGDLLARGSRVVLIDRDADTLQDTICLLQDEYGDRLGSVVADLADLESIRGSADALVADWEIGALVNNAGGWLPGEQYPDVDPDTWLSSLTVNLIAPMLLTQLLWPALASVSGAVVNIGSSGGVGDGPYGSPEYAAAKAGLRRFSASLGTRPDVRVMAVVPGWIGLDRAIDQWAALSADQQREVGPLIPPEDIAEVVVALLERGRPGEVVEMLELGERRSSIISDKQAT